MRRWTECPPPLTPVAPPQEIRYFKADGKLTFLYETAKAAVSGASASGGKLVVIDQAELMSVHKPK